METTAEEEAEIVPENSFDQERILVCVSASPTSSDVIRRAAKLSKQTVQPSKILASITLPPYYYSSSSSLTEITAGAFANCTSVFSPPLKSL